MTAAQPTSHDAMQGELRWVALPRSDAASTLPYRPYWTGLHWQLGTAAFWETLANQTPDYETHRLGASFAEEVGACLLGGYGMPFWLAQAAFERLRDAGAFTPGGWVTANELETLLSAPLEVRGERRRYRFPRQRAVRLASALSAIRTKTLPSGDCELRDWLLTIPGIGPKTASWIVRNHRSSDHVAIVDVHLARAGVVAGVFDARWRLPRDYDIYEAAFLGWAEHSGIRASHLDACIWGVLAHDQNAARDILGLERLNETPRPVWSI
jgi:hypothetical protein